MPPSPEKQKAFENAVAGVVAAQNRLMKHQIEMSRLDAEILTNQSLMNAFAAQMSRNPGMAPLHVQHMDRWVKATLARNKMAAKYPQLVGMLNKAQQQLTKAAKDMT